MKLTKIPRGNAVATQTRYHHPRGDRKSAEAIENRRDSDAPLRKRVRNCMKLLRLQGCDRKQRGWGGEALPRVDERGPSRFGRERGRPWGRVAQGLLRSKVKSSEWSNFGGERLLGAANGDEPKRRIHGGERRLGLMERLAFLCRLSGICRLQAPQLQLGPGGSHSG